VDDVVRLVLVRHGETAWNAEGRWQGQTGVGLNALGRQQAEVTAAHLAAAHPGATLIARSDAQRVAETAAPLEARLDVPVLVDPRLREIDVGRWSGRTRAEVRAMDPDGYAAYRRGAPLRIGGGETVAELGDRMLDALGDVVATVGRGTAVVVTHGWALRVAIARLIAGPDAAPVELTRAANCSVTVVDVHAGGAALAGWAGCDHLELHGLVAGEQRADRERGAA
jgi:glucosyl-3-phosphoglycerate phosphatase